MSERVDLGVLQRWPWLVFDVPPPLFYQIVECDVPPVRGSEHEEADGFVSGVEGSHSEINPTKENAHAREECSFAPSSRPTRIQTKSSPGRSRCCAPEG